MQTRAASFCSRQTIMPLWLLYTQLRIQKPQRKLRSAVLSNLLSCNACKQLAHLAAGDMVSWMLQIDKERRRDRQERSADYDSHLGILRDPITREVIKTST